jgi:3-mercaptopyruvate sulfurtransferase SseA
MNRRTITMKIFLMLSLFGAMIFGFGCQAASSNSAGKVVAAGEPIVADDAPRINLEDAKKAFDAGDALFIDTRGDAQYKSEHIKGAINITMSDVVGRLKEIPTNKKIIAYCS